MPVVTVPRRLGASPVGLGDVLEQLTTAYAEMMDRHGPLRGMEGVTPPAEASTFAADQARLAARQDSEADALERLNILLERRAREHEQIGRLASFVAGYELAHGDPGHAPAIAELGGDHFDLAAQTRATLAEQGGLAVNQNDKTLDPVIADPLAAMGRGDTLDQVKAEHGHTPTRPHGQEL